jgi:sugar lactone lactonase YvrE
LLQRLGKKNSFRSLSRNLERHTLLAMKISATPFAAAAAALLAGCAAGGSTPQQQSVTQSLRADAYPLGAYGAKITAGELRSAAPARDTLKYHVDAKSRLVYVSNLGAGAIDVFDQKGHDQTPIATITDGILGPGGLTTDKKGNLYVADEGPISGKWTVQVYAPGTTTPAKSYTTDLDSPTDTAVGKDGSIYIANFNGLKNGWVAVYPQGDTSKEYRLSDFNGGAPLSVALDAKGNLYVMYDIDTNTEDVSAVNEYAPGATSGTNLNLQFNAGGGIQVDRKGNIIVAQQLDPSEILIFPRGQTQASKEISMPGGGEPFNFALNHGSKTLFAAEYYTANQIDRFAYPSTKFQYVIANNFNNPSGVAVAPTEF